MTELPYLSATEALDLFRRRALSPVELLEAILEHADQSEPQINAFTARYDESALDDAREAEARYARDAATARPLEGLPVAIKELTPIAGQQHTLGSLALADNVATETAPSAARILAAGGIVHARSASSEFGCASHTFSRLHGITRNPWNLQYSPAGSSGGSAAALAAGTTTLAQGSDSAGSLRLPAAACGVVGYKPPHGSVAGALPLSLETCHHDGPMARTVDDCALLYRVIAGPDATDPTSLGRPRPTLPSRPDGIDGWRIALVPGVDGLDVDPEVSANLYATADALRNAGAHVDEVDLAWSYDRIVEATRLHFAATYGPMVQRVAQAEPDLVTGYALDFVAIEERCQEVPGFLLRANELTAELWAPVAEAFHDHQALLLPTAAHPAPAAGEAGLEFGPDGPLPDDLERPAWWTIGLTVPFNLCSWSPAMSVPSGLSSSGVPTGAQIIGRPYDDTSVFLIAKSVEHVRPWGHPKATPPQSSAQQTTQTADEGR